MVENKIVNGVDVTRLFSTIEDKPEIENFKFRATNKWVHGTHCRATTKDFTRVDKWDD